MITRDRWGGSNTLVIVLIEIKCQMFSIFFVTIIWFTFGKKSCPDFWSFEEKIFISHLGVPGKQFHFLKGWYDFLGIRSNNYESIKSLVPKMGCGKMGGGGEAKGGGWGGDRMSFVAINNVLLFTSWGVSAWSREGDIPAQGTSIPLAINEDNELSLWLLVRCLFTLPYCWHSENC